MTLWVINNIEIMFPILLYRKHYFDICDEFTYLISPPSFKIQGTTRTLSTSSFGYGLAGVHYHDPIPSVFCSAAICISSRRLSTRADVIRGSASSLISTVIQSLVDAFKILLTLSAAFILKHQRKKWSSSKPLKLRILTMILSPEGSIFTPYKVTKYCPH